MFVSFLFDCEYAQTLQARSLGSKSPPTRFHEHVHIPPRCVSSYPDLDFLQSRSSAQQVLRLKYPSAKKQCRREVSNEVLQATSFSTSLCFKPPKPIIVAVVLHCLVGFLKLQYPGSDSADKRFQTRCHKQPHPPPRCVWNYPKLCTVHAAHAGHGLVTCADFAGFVLPACKTVQVSYAACSASGVVNALCVRSVFSCICSSFATYSCLILNM